MGAVRDLHSVLFGGHVEAVKKRPKIYEQSKRLLNGKSKILKLGLSTVDILQFENMFCLLE